MSDSPKTPVSSIGPQDERDFYNALGGAILIEIDKRTKDNDIADALVDAPVLDKKFLLIYEHRDEDSSTKLETIIHGLTGNRPSKDLEIPFTIYHIDLNSEELLMRMTGPVDTLPDIKFKNMIQNGMMQRGISVFAGDTRVMTDGVMSTGILGIETISNATQLEIETAAGVLRAASSTGTSNVQFDAQTHSIDNGKVTINGNPITAIGTGGKVNLAKTSGFIR